LFKIKQIQKNNKRLRKKYFTDPVKVIQRFLFIVLPPQKDGIMVITGTGDPDHSPTELFDRLEPVVYICYNAGHISL